MTEEIEVQLPLNGLAAVLPFAAKKDVRYYLNGVMVEVTPEGVTYAGTNGHALAVAKCAYDDNANSVAFILGRKDVETIVKNIASTEALRIKTDGKFGLEIAFGSHRIKTQRIDGKFPDFRAVMTVDGEQRGQNSCFNPAYLALVQKSISAAKKFGGLPRLAGLHMENNGANKPSTLFTSGDGIELGYVVMPLRDKPAVTTVDGGLLAPLLAAWPSSRTTNPSRPSATRSSRWRRPATCRRWTTPPASR